MWTSREWTQRAIELEAKAKAIGNHWHDANVNSLLLQAEYARKTAKAMSSPEYWINCGYSIEDAKVLASRV